MINNSYRLFIEFIEAYFRDGFRNIRDNDPLVLELEEQMKKDNQFFLVGDYVQFKVLYTSKRSTEMMGISPEDINPYNMMVASHPEDIARFGMGRAKLVNLAKDLFIAESGRPLFSSSLRMRNRYGQYDQWLFQHLLIYGSSPYKTVYLLGIYTSIDQFKKRKHGFHYYVGDDLSNFRFPDEELLKIGINFSSRELEIIKLVSLGMESEQIADKIFLSVHTVNTHRRNILKKTGKAHISELIYELKDQGVL